MIDDRFDWAKFTNPHSKKTAKDLKRLCEPLLTGANGKLRDLLERLDDTGLCPIHWAAINNRADIINLLVSYGSNLERPCNNRLLSNGTPMHLAAMNGSLEAAASILENHSKIQERSESRKTKSEQRLDFLRCRDSDGQTPLMRTATHKSRRVNLLFDLLRKNFWTLGSRPAELALYLIGHGADWRQTEPTQGMNLLHLAIVNDYDDIVNLLLVIDVQLVDTSIKLSARTVETQLKKRSSDEREDDSEGTPLVDKDEQLVESVISHGLKSLELAILYRRVSIIYLLWFVQSKSNPNADNDQRADSPKWSLIKACFTNTDELLKFVKPLLFRFALAVDFSLYFLTWVPLSLHHNKADRLVFTSFMISIVLTLATVFRVMMRDPGYLRVNSVQYLSEVSHILARRQLKSGSDKASEQGKREGRPVDLIKLQDKEMVVRQPGTNDVVSGASKSFTRIVVPDSVDREGDNDEDDLVEKVRLLCHKCRCVRRPRSRHCDHCNQCVQDFDHHCIYLGCCIGRLNRLDFFIAMIMLTVSSVYGTIIYLSSSSGGSPFWHFVGFVWVFKYALIGGISAFSILRRACLGVTMYEEIRAKRIRAGLGREAIDNYKRRQMWRFPANRFLTGELSIKQITNNFFEFANYRSLDEYLLDLISADTPLARSLANKNARVNMYKFV